MQEPGSNFLPNTAPGNIGLLFEVERDLACVRRDASLATMGINNYLSFANAATAGPVERHKHPGWDGVEHWARSRKLITADPIVSPPNHHIQGICRVVGVRLVESCTFAVAYVDYQREAVFITSVWRPS